MLVVAGYATNRPRNACTSASKFITTKTGSGLRGGLIKCGTQSVFALLAKNIVCIQLS